MFFFDNFWMIRDGDGEKSSTNGTWLFVENFFEVFDRMVIKVGETLFQALLFNDITNENIYKN